jgi:hypothetical protein
MVVGSILECFKTQRKNMNHTYHICYIQEENHIYFLAEYTSCGPVQVGKAGMQIYSNCFLIISTNNCL